MRTLLLATVCTVLFAGPALSCRGVAEYPQFIKQLEASDLPAEQKDELMGQLLVGQSLHEQGHHADDSAMRGAAMRILDQIKEEVELD